MRRRGRALLLPVVLAVLGAGTTPPEPTGYRTDDYSSPTPATLTGARVVSTAEAEALWRAHGAVFIDVFPQAPRPPDLPAGTLWRDPPHDGIPGSVWLPDTGYGELAPVTAAYFARGLATATGGDRARPVVIYCKPACWMSWNAAKRALAIGYREVDWYPDGVRGWRRAGLPLERETPVAREPAAANPSASSTTGPPG